MRKRLQCFRVNWILRAAPHQCSLTAWGDWWGRGRKGDAERHSGGKGDFQRAFQGELHWFTAPYSPFVGEQRLSWKRRAQHPSHHEGVSHITINSNQYASELLDSSWPRDGHANFYAHMVAHHHCQLHNNYLFFIALYHLTYFSSWNFT